MIHRWRASLVWRWLVVGLVVMTGLGLAGRLSWSWYQRRLTLSELTAANELVPVPTLPQKFDHFVIDSSPLNTSDPAASVSTLVGKIESPPILISPTPVVSMKALDTPASINSLKPDADLSVPYVKGIDLLLFQDGQETLVLRGKEASGSETAVRYAYPQLSPNGKLVAFFEWLNPKIKNQLATADMAVLKILDITTGKIRTTSYQFADLTHDLDGGLPVKWNARNYLEIEQQLTPLKISHVLLDPDRGVVMAENNLSLIPESPWPQLPINDILRGFSISPDGQWQIVTSATQFVLTPVGSEKRLPIEIGEIKQGHLVRLFGWYGKEVWFDVEQKTAKACNDKALQAKTEQSKNSELTWCFQNHHYLVAVDPISQQITRRWYNYQIGESEQWRWIRLVQFLQQATLNQRNEIVYFESHVPLIYPANQRVKLWSSYDNKQALVVTPQVAELVTEDGQKMSLAFTNPVTADMVYRSSYSAVWTGNNRYVVLYASGYDDLASQRVLVVDTSLKSIQLITQGGSLFTLR